MTNKKLTLSFLTGLTLVVLAGCAGSYDEKIEQPTLKEGDREEYVELIETGKIELEAIKSSGGNQIETMVDIAVSNDRMGNYDEAIKDYREILDIDPKHYLSLNNLTVIYEKAGDSDLAEEYVLRLHESYPADEQAVSDAVRILAINKDFDQAFEVINTFAQNYQTEANTAFIDREKDFLERSKGVANQ